MSLWRFGATGGSCLSRTGRQAGGMLANGGGWPSAAGTRSFGSGEDRTGPWGGRMEEPYDRSRHSQVYVSQSNDPLSNVALEDWVSNNMDLKNKNLLVLSNNIMKDKSMNIKASFLGTEGDSAEPAGTVFSSLPASLPFSALPQVTRHSNATVVELGLSSDVERGTVYQVLESIGRNFLQGQASAGGDMDNGGAWPPTDRSSSSTHQQGFNRLSLVRPDDGWFPGITGIRSELATAEAEMEAINRDKHRRQQDYSRRQSSFGR